MYRIRYLLMVLLAAFGLASITLLFAEPATSERFLLPSLVLSAWCVLCLTLAYFFAGMKADAGPDAGFFQRISHSIHRAFSYLLALLFTLASLLLLYFSTTAIRVAW